MLRLVSPRRFLFESRIEKGSIDVGTLPLEELEKLAYSNRPHLRATVAVYEGLSKTALSKLARDKRLIVCSAAFSNQETPPDDLAEGADRFVGDIPEGRYSPLKNLAGNPATPSSALEKIFVAATHHPVFEQVSDILAALCANPNTPSHALVYLETLYANRPDNMFNMRDWGSIRKVIYSNDSFPTSRLWEKTTLYVDDESIYYQGWSQLSVRLQASKSPRGGYYLLLSLLSHEVDKAKENRGSPEGWDEVYSRISSVFDPLTDAQIIAAEMLLDGEMAYGVPSVFDIIASAKEIAPAPVRKQPEQGDSPGLGATLGPLPR